MVDEDEKRVLGNILTRAERDGVAADVQAWIYEMRPNTGSRFDMTGCGRR